MSIIQETKKEYTAEEKAAYRQKKFDRYNAAYEEAATEISKGSEEKIKNAENEKKTQAILYTFYFMKDREAKQDTKGVKIAFGDNIRMYDILTKGKGHFLKVLNAKFNKENESKYHCGFFRRVNPDGNGFNEWNIYVSWKNREIKAKPENDGFEEVKQRRPQKKSLFTKDDKKEETIKKEVKTEVETENVVSTRFSNLTTPRASRPHHLHPRGPRMGGENGFQGRGGFHGRGHFQGRGGFHGRGGRGGFQGRGGRGGFQGRGQMNNVVQPPKPTGPSWANKLKGGAGPLDKKTDETTQN